MKFLVFEAALLESAGFELCGKGCSGFKTFVDFVYTSVPNCSPCSDLMPTEDSASSLTGNSEVLTGMVCSFGASAAGLGAIGF